MAKPADVTDIDSWLYNHKKSNIVLGTDGSMLVLDPKDRDITKPVKTIPFKRGVDAYGVLTRPSFYGEELRVLAAEKLSGLVTDRQGAVDAAYAAVIAADQKYVEAIDAWEADKTSAKALVVAETQQQLAKSEETYRKTMYPHREIHTIELARKDVDYRTKDDRMLPYEVCLETYDTTTVVERAVPIVADKA